MRTDRPISPRRRLTCSSSSVAGTMILNSRLSPSALVSVTFIADRSPLTIHLGADRSGTPLVRAGGFEPPRFTSLEPKSSASANSAAPAPAGRCPGRHPGQWRRVLTHSRCPNIAGQPVDPGSARRSPRAQQIAHRGGRGDSPLVAVGLVVGLDAAEPAEVIDHHPGRLLQALLRDVA